MDKMQFIQFDALMYALTSIHMAILTAEMHRLGMTSDEDYKELLTSLMDKAVEDWLSPDERENLQ